MHIDLRTVSIQPLRQTFDHLARRFGDKPSSRYQEGSYDIQAVENLHYRPTWDPDQTLYDASVTQIVMSDWYVLKDPRQFYYSTYTLARARQQETTEANFNFVETRGLVDLLPDALRQRVLNLLVPLRHAAWGANLNNTFVCSYGYGTVFTQPCMYQAMDNLGIAQYLSRIGLLLGSTDALEAGKAAWMEGDAWQGLRRYTEDCLVVRDPFELFVAQNVALDGLLYPLVYQGIVDDQFAADGGALVAMLTQFMSDWFEETRKWVDAVMKVAAAESEHNRALLQAWTIKWRDRAAAALLPVIEQEFAGNADEVMSEQLAAFRVRLDKTGVGV
ncbi:aromatic/alkene monooxygenase hydroxylase subunit beta [Pseudomonas extremaustralis]|jgi:phenol/toluene 2-monooxygenase (NADH) P1/A1|uniref:Phenol 2-monooxygenase P1 subunit n=1 Tax=Pseudomonas extremaustralis TaxID=359110 RepID=A0A5C5QB25_9PSED|nr:aromatic/alkene monooxygenase hydroxylase subunit beta [Pseudomonas extremaustralis]EZI24930.1 phenol hydroxylase [Pseudomonas extremaustralis 14-3 substr. 14-3b]MDB1112619.1 aromatic/alkene monooxygenase hydroxylase subunit beta [Pseudomonas extremaustralis]MDF3134242.1 aromatic/alkene monooxygenase hydroxylase subunit beta [Pseudomonas extremaustralis]MDG2970756.1 aromatic/alkene monooxygenase hydroxylase subunit beta [Pseudomonas extremaustralis]TWS00951.1 phenol hydroxylase [Pseudomonas